MFDKFKDKLKSVIKTPEIEFLCYEEDYGLIPEPYSSRKFMPEWFKALPPKVNKENKLDNSTIKRCAPFLDSMTVGWIIPLVADVEFITNEDAGGVNYKWKFHRTMVENHNYNQVTSDQSPNPNMPKPPMKFLNWWAIKVPPGYSVLFVPPLNRQDSRFTCMSGFVDVDGYFEFINFPFFFHATNYTGILEAGTPLIQAIPIRRDAILTKDKIRKFEKKDHDDLFRTRRTREIHESVYRDKIWSRK